MTGRLAGLAPARRRLLYVAGAVLLVLCVLLVVVLVRPGTDPVADQATPGPVVLVPGYGGTADDLDPVAAELRREDRTVVPFVPTEGNRGDLRVQAQRLGRLVQRLVDEGAPSVDLVGYSAGGVIVRLYVEDDGGRSVVRRVLTLGSPHHGTDVAALAQDAAGGCPTACEQLATGSDLLRRLNAGDETPPGPVWTTVRTDADRTVVPVDSAVLEGADNVLVQAVCPDATTSHAELPGDPLVIGLLRTALGTQAPGGARVVSC